LNQLTVGKNENALHFKKDSILRGHVRHSGQFQRHECDPEKAS